MAASLGVSHGDSIFCVRPGIIILTKLNLLIWLLATMMPKDRIGVWIKYVKILICYEWKEGGVNSKISKMHVWLIFYGAFCFLVFSLMWIH